MELNPIVTPHRGSFLASNPIAKFGNKFINLPGGLAKSAVQLGKLRESRMQGTPFVIPTALDNMDASSPFIKTLASLPIAPGVHAHSIRRPQQPGALMNLGDQQSSRSTYKPPPAYGKQT